MQNIDRLVSRINPLNAELNPICHLLALFGAHPIFHVSKIRVKEVEGFFFSISYNDQQMHSYFTNYLTTTCFGGPGSSFGIATELRAGRSGDRIPVGERFSAPVQTGPGANPASCTMGTESFLGGKERPGHDAEPLPLSSTEVLEE